MRWAFNTALFAFILPQAAVALDIAWLRHVRRGTPPGDSSDEGAAVQWGAASGAEALQAELARAQAVEQRLGALWAWARPAHKPRPALCGAHS